MSDHHHYEYASDRHDHRGEYADERHDHDNDYAERHHRHYDLEKEDGRLRDAIREMGDVLNQLRGELQGALAQIRVLDRLRPTCVICLDATADRQTVMGPGVHRLRRRPAGRRHGGRS